MAKDEKTAAAEGVVQNPRVGRRGRTFENRVLAPLGPNSVGGQLMPRRVVRPNTPKKAIAAVSSLYVEARRGNIYPEDAAKLAYVARTACDLHKDHILQQELDALKQDVARIIAALQVKV